MCWQTRRRIPRWIHGACSRSEADAIAAHVGACAACAGEAALVAALADAGGAGEAAARREATWARFQCALTREAEPAAARNCSASGPRLRRSLIAAALVLGLFIGGRWWRERPTGERGRAPHLTLTLWESEPGVDDPMGATTDRLLALLEGRQ